MIDTVTINGTLIDPCFILAQVTVIHGRKGFGEASVPNSATVVVTQAQGSMPAWQSGDTITLDGPDGRMFAGRIVQRTLTHDQGLGLFTLTCAGPLAVLGVRKVGDVPWPQETGAARAARILADAGTPWQVEGTIDLQVLPRDVDAQPAAALLDDLASDTSAAVFDTPSGEVVYQALSGRNRPIVPYMWSDFPPADVWSGFDPALTWDGAPPSFRSWVSPSHSRIPLVLPCDAVGWEPEWSSSETMIINHIRVAYGAADPQEFVDLVDEDSIDRHGERYAQLGTQLATSADADARAAHIITTQADGRWQIGDVVLHLPALTTAARKGALRLVCGDHVTLQGLPQPAPAIDWTGIVEGWTYTMHAAGGQFHEQLVLALSDPLLSLAVMRWDEYPALYLWSQHPAALVWDDLYSTDVLEAA